MIKTDSDLPSNHSEKNSSEAKNYTRMSRVLVHFHVHQAIPEQQSEWCLRSPKAQIHRTSWCSLEEMHWFHDCESVCYFSFPNVYKEYFSYAFFTQDSVTVRVLHNGNAQTAIFVIVACEGLCVCELQGSLS